MRIYIPECTCMQVVSHDLEDTKNPSGTLDPIDPSDPSAVLDPLDINTCHPATQPHMSKHLICWVMGHLPMVVSEHLAPLLDRNLIETRVTMALSELEPAPNAGPQSRSSGASGPSSVQLVIEAWPASSLKGQAPLNKPESRLHAAVGSSVENNVIAAGMPVGGTTAEVESALQAAVRAAASRGAASDEVLRESLGMMMHSIRYVNRSRIGNYSRHTLILTLIIGTYDDHRHQHCFLLCVLLGFMILTCSLLMNGP